MSQSTHAFLKFSIILTGLAIGAIVGLLAGIKPLLLGVGICAIVPLTFFFSNFELSILGLLVLRSSLDPFSKQQLPAAFALGVDVLAILYVVVQLLTRQPIKIDRFWWFLIGWMVLQGLWVVLLPLGGLGLDGSALPMALREWIRMFSWSMVYFLVMQLKDRVPPEKVINTLFLALIIPVLIGLLQQFVPSVLPPLLSASGEDFGAIADGKVRIRSTLGGANTFSTFLLLYIGLTWWRLERAINRLPWLLLLVTLAFLMVQTKTLVSLMMMSVFIGVMIVPRLSFLSLIGGFVLFALMIVFFGSTEFGQQRLGEIGNTPLLNRDIDLWRAILLSQGDGNSFNWRLAYWTQLLNSWQYHPILGYGLGLTIIVGGGTYFAHNDFVRALVEGGIIGFLTFLIFLGAQSGRLLYLMRSSLATHSQRNLCNVLFAFSIAIPVGMLTENIWTHTTLFFYWWTLVALAGWNWAELHSADASKEFPALDAN
ncbi:MAG: O-antigen ligase family protein [Leptolyngbyaceae cyanobacterium bins.59]|nr:O-antigen ligase family protein [Leptolyngbyaceae cyanobacterium bins.59]